MCNCSSPVLKSWNGDLVKIMQYIIKSLLVQTSLCFNVSCNTLQNCLQVMKSLKQASAKYLQMHGIKKKNCQSFHFCHLIFVFLSHSFSEGLPSTCIRQFPCLFDTTEYFFLCHSYLIIAVVVLVFFKNCPCLFCYFLKV